LDNHTSLGRRWTRIIAVLAVLTVISVPVAVFAAGGHFTDDDASIFEPSINWMADSGVTLGCNPPTNDHYCPDANVTRGQMAAFMQRLAENQVVDAATAIEADHATNSNALMGEAGTHYDNPAYGISCTGNACDDGAALTTTVVLQTDVAAPESGFLTVSTQYSANQTATGSYTQTWVTVDSASGCGSWFGGPFEATPGSWTVSSVDGGVTFTTNSTTTVVPVAAGTHTLRLCAIGIQAIDSQEASMTATFTSEGGVTPAAVAATPADFTFFIEGFDGVVPVE